MIGIKIWDLDWELGFGIGDRDQGFGLELGLEFGIENWDWGLGLEIGWD